MKLYQKKCIPCDGNIPPFSISQMRYYCKKIKSWKIKKNKFYYLNKIMKFKNFLESLKFVNKISLIAEKENHHPDLKFGWGYVEITILTHAIKGLSESDFILASKIDKLSNS